MKRDKGLYALYLFYAVNFVAVGLTTYAPKFYGEIGLTDGQIGLISAIMAAVALFAQPMWGLLADRARYMRSVVAGALAAAGLTCFLVLPATQSFLPLLLVLTLYNTFQLPAMPVGNAIAIEYTGSRGHAFGPVRMMGTVGYQVGILVMGFVLAKSLRGLYPALGVMSLCAAGCALLLPPVRGYQHDEARVSPAVFLRDRRFLLLFTVAFLAHIGHQFNLSFFSKHLGDLGVSNTVTGFINTLSVILEVPVLLFGDRIMKRMSLWTWMTLALLIGAARFTLLSVVTSPVLIVLAQMLSFVHTACFEFFPFIYLGRVARKELLGSAQSVFQTISFGFARILGALGGGLLADAAGIPAVYAGFGGLMLVTAALFFLPMRQQAQIDARAQKTSKDV